MQHWIPPTISFSIVSFLAITSSAADPGVELSLFNGQNLDGWEAAQGAAEPCWTVAAGELICTGQKGTWLRSKSEYGDFNLGLEYKLQAGGNSGVYIRVPQDGNHHGPAAGIEVQILDDAAEPYAKLKPYQYCGSLYGIAPASQRVGRPVGQWNSLEINCRGTHYQVRHNGIVVIDADVEQFPALQERRDSGYLGLQNHNERVAFRNLRIGPAY